MGRFADSLEEPPANHMAIALLGAFLFRSKAIQLTFELPPSLIRKVALAKKVTFSHKGYS